MQVLDNPLTFPTRLRSLGARTGLRGTSRRHSSYTGGPRSSVTFVENVKRMSKKKGGKPRPRFKEYGFAAAARKVSASGACPAPGARPSGRRRFRGPSRQRRDRRNPARDGAAERPLAESRDPLPLALRSGPGPPVPAGSDRSGPKVPGAGRQGSLPARAVLDMKADLAGVSLPDARPARRLPGSAPAGAGGGRPPET
jgi:hypothetical protein